MPRTSSKTCEVCARIGAAVRAHRPRPVFPRDERFTTTHDPRSGWARSLETEGLRFPTPFSSSAPVKRLYVREGGQYVGIGSICGVGHVDLDDPAVEGEPDHLLTPTLPVRVLCLHSGELVETTKQEK